MKYENSKSAILIFLVLVSIFLTWNLWTFQPHFETMDKNNYVAEVTLSEKQEVKKIIRPDVAFYHIKGEHHGTTKTEELDKLIKELSQWVFYDVKNYSGKVTNFTNLIHGNGNTEIVFPDEIPIELYRNVLNFEEKRLPSFSFDRIIIGVENSEKENGVVYFASTSTQQVYVSHISTALLSNFYQDFYKNSIKYPRYFSVKSTDKRLIYLPEGRTDMMEYKYLPVTLNSEEFKEALFKDPSFVQKSFVPQGEEYTNGFSKMNINYVNNMLLYVNPTVDTDFVENSNDLVKQSIDFVNEHGGWTDPYRYVNKDDLYHKVTFRLYSMDGYPVFNSRGMSEVNVAWGRSEINKYVRPNISLELPLRSEMKEVKTPSGHEALAYLQSKKNFRMELLEDLVLGYQMERDEGEPKLILLEPAWFYRYNKTWNSINTEDLGGEKYGLE